MPTTIKMTTKFQELIARKEPLIMPGGFSPWFAKMAEVLGFEAFFMAGSQTAQFLMGLPDIGVAGLRDFVDHARHMAARTNIPIFVDADTGFGNAVNVHYAVQEYIRAGVAGMHIEDQEFPKKSGPSAGKRCISVEEAVGKYKAAVAAKNELDSDFVICARCDAAEAEGETFESAIQRSIAYAEQAKVDVVWFNGVSSREQIAQAVKRIPAPVMTSYYGAPPTPSLEEWRQLGVAVAIFPAILGAVASQAGWAFLKRMQEEGPAAMDSYRQEVRAGKWGTPDHSKLSDDALIRSIEDQFVPTELQRDYEHTFGHGGRPSA
ncbi:MAG: isocitrate lyase/PEP mutase family protein [Chloroflexi bacterium]|nr:isocitrate lyase/PEP mutase family protein [Chloroflexota bacterium]